MLDPLPSPIGMLDPLPPDESDVEPSSSFYLLLPPESDVGPSTTHESPPMIQFFKFGTFPEPGDLIVKCHNPPKRVCMDVFSATKSSALVSVAHPGKWEPFESLMVQDRVETFISYMDLSTLRIFQHPIPDWKKKGLFCTTGMCSNQFLHTSCLLEQCTSSERYKKTLFAVDIMEWDLVKHYQNFKTHKEFTLQVYNLPPPIPAHECEPPTKKLKTTFVEPSPVHQTFVEPSPVYHTFVEPSPVPETFVEPSPVPETFVEPSPVPEKICGAFTCARN
ncbi:hypothetical protein HNY73_001648 [Argiope bruennichi]|uniref:Uncharacterized protein n=1 Tax=Argiope bruennichi TaxID=94029 RepID=A0A8T0FR62_ARGBR|nr:hypothetical protein HNY73_001648 [Argiope bruennichi]